MGFARWEEVPVSYERGNRLIHFEVVGLDGRSEVAVVGREKSPRHLSFAVVPQFLMRLGVARRVRLKTKKEVADWLDSVVAGGSLSCGSLPQVDRYHDDEEPCPSEEPPPKKMRYVLKSFSWLGIPWICKKRRRHYKSFSRNGVTISVNDFVYVMAEQQNRLVAHLEDMYEDSRGASMVSVRWFHKFDEVGLDLPHKYNDREIFFSLCLQDLSVECIDGLATVLSPQHFGQYLEWASKNAHWNPYMCHRQFDNDEIKPFDITYVQGYRNQNIFLHMFGSVSSVNNHNHRVNGASDSLKCKIKQKHGSTDLYQRVASGLGFKFEEKVTVSTDRASQKNQNKVESYLSVGQHVEVLSQDSGMRGCWFRAVIVKKQKHKVKVRYQDLHDAVDDTCNLEEWIPAVRIASPDKLGMRLCGRATLRPFPSSDMNSFPSFNVGAAVDVRCHDGWWEGIVVKPGDEGKFLVYFPGEGNNKLCECKDLRPSLDWLNNKWNAIEEVPHLAKSVLKDKTGSSKAGLKQVLALASAVGPSGNCSNVEASTELIRSQITDVSQPDSSIIIPASIGAPWNCKVPRKRRRGREGCGKGNNLTLRSQRINLINARRQCDEDRENCNRSGNRVEDGSSFPCERHAISNALKMEREVCKYDTNPLVVAPIPLSNLVMSR